MYAALLNKKLVLAVEEANLVCQKVKELNGEDYRCPHCQKKVILIISQSKAAFFKHWIHYEEGQGEKEEHHQSKMLLKTAFTAAGFNAQTEVPLASGQLRADVLISKALALEVQCAPLSLAEFNHRHHLYQNIDIVDLWIVGHRHYLKKNLKKTQLIFFRHNKLWENYYLEVIPKRQLLRLKYNVLQEPITNKLIYQTAIFKLDEEGIKYFWQFKPLLKNYSLNEEEQKKYFYRQIQQKTKKGLAWAEALYKSRMTMKDLPDTLFKVWRNPGEVDSIMQYLQEKS